MEAITNVSKRKRRKTRRRLNELKKRCEQMPVNSKLHSGPKKLSTNVNNYISSNRLTLFNKVIQSKTVLRGQLINVDSKIHVENKSLRTISNNTIPMIYTQQKRNSDDWISNSEIDLNISDTDITQQSILSIKDFKSISSVDSQDPVSSVENVTSSDSVSEVHSDLYEEFMNNIPIYLKELVPQLLEYDAMKKNKLFLRQIQLEMKNRNKEILDQTSFSIPISQQLTYNKSDLSSNISSSSQYSCRQNLGMEPYSPQTNFSEQNSPSSNSLSSVTSKHYYLPTNYDMEQDSPEYTYYPHRLNQ